MNQESRIKNIKKNAIIHYSLFPSASLRAGIIRKARGFTLIELIVVIGILAVLAGGLIAIFDPFTQFQKTQDAKRKSDLSQIQKSLETYYQDNGRYPDNPSVTDYRIKGLDGNSVPWGQRWQPYMNVLPKDPNSAKQYIYYVSPASNGQGYYLYASLDRGGKDPQACHADSSKCDNAPIDASCGGICNFGVSSPNLTP